VGEKRPWRGEDSLQWRVEAITGGRSAESEERKKRRRNGGGGESD
jgi:hypothetical protein